ncbi:hypothetical protein [Kitasatospora camelliae]|uniref:Uncharacterized protein n=1 Tax=Kitasatospora camelliae TaxID=3156397 RepID=A0AAU8K1X9_9ACTN
MDSSSLVSTRRALHAVAELLLAGPQYRASGTIRLRAHPGGFATRLEPRLQVVGAELMGAGRRLPLRATTCAELAAAVGVEPGAPAGLYGDGSGASPQDAVDADPVAAELIAGCFAAADAVLRELFPGADPVIWPEHFDIGVTVDGVNYGVSPGDAYSSAPYAYVGPHTPRTGPFWNAPFGAARPMSELADRPALREFLAEGCRQAAL